MEGTVWLKRNPAYAEIARNASGWMQRLLPQKCKKPHFFILHWSLSVEFRITKFYDLGRL